MAGEASAQPGVTLLAPLYQLSRDFALPWLVCLARAVVPPMEQQVIGNAFTVVGVN